ncbi:MAG: chorismate synthase [Nanoarchaeota archaeon]|nr:chorismate synthase [Nanoarchaeota archaeon]
MTGNTFGKLFRITTFGESHGTAIGVIIDGVKSNLTLSEEDIQKDLDRRKPGQSSITTQRKEDDKVQILSGIFEGKTTGTPVCMIIYNKDYQSKDYSNIKDIFRPGHADFTYHKKYGIRDYRGGGRSSGRETAARVAAGAVARKILKLKNINITAYVKEIGGIKAQTIDLDEIEQNIVRCPDKEAALDMIKKIKQVQEEKDSIGGVVEVIVKGCPAGLGEPVFNKLNAVLAHALMSIGAVKAVEIGSGIACSKMKGSESNDSLVDGNFISNNAGGILGGISSGQDILARVAVKPTPSIARIQKTIDMQGKETDITIEGRHDPCICPRIVPVVEAMAALVIIDALMIHEARQDR